MYLTQNAQLIAASLKLKFMIQVLYIPQKCTDMKRVKMKFVGYLPKYTASNLMALSNNKILLTSWQLMNKEGLMRNKF